MRTFIVVTEEYERYGPTGDIKVELKHAETVEAMLAQIEPDWMTAEADEDEFSEPDTRTTIERFQDYNGDGANYYVIKELVDGKLVDII